MFIWLNLGDSEWWFRFFGVIMGIISVAGIYKSIEKVWNYQAASIAVVMLACTKWFVFYIQECAEYNLMLASLSWFIFAWICLMEKVTPKRIIFFLIMGTLSVYSQYGAIFPVAAFSIIAFIYILSKKNKREIRQITIGYAATLIFAVLPLWLFL